MKCDGDIGFEWDPAKTESNIAKHGVSFEDATRVFEDPFARVIDDPDHFVEEDRSIIIGLDGRARELTVCHCHRNAVIRIISARKARRRRPSSIGGT